MKLRSERVKPGKQITFPPFRLDALNQRLYRERQEIPLRPKTFAVLQRLLEHPGQLVTKDELLDAVWPEVSVSDAVLKGCIREIREALGDDPKAPQFIETAHRRGYRFIGKITEDLEAERGEDRKTERQSDAEAVLAISLSPILPVFPVGREAELAQLQSWLEKALGGQCQVVFVTGEPGIGKTTVVEAFLTRAAANPHIWIARGQCLEQYGASEAYLPVLDALARLCREPGREKIIALLKTQAPMWLAQMPWLISVAEREALQREMLGATRERMLREMAETLETLTADTPLLLVLEDLHWSDYSTLDLVSYLARRREPARLLLLGTYRPAEVGLSRHPLQAVKLDLQMRRQCEELSLGFLTEGAVAEYLDARFPAHQFPAGLARLIHQRTDGNPLFTVNVVDHLTTHGLIGRLGERWTMKVALAKVELSAPESIRQMIESQINRLDQEEQRVLEVAGVAGVEFSAVAVASGLQGDVIQVEEWCEGLARRRQFLRPAGTSVLPDGRVTTRYGFIHALYQNALYERVAVARRAQLHQRIGEHWEAVYGRRSGELAAELAMRFEQGRDFERAVKYLQRAAENATLRFASQEAVTLARHGLELLKTLPETPERAGQELTLRMTLCAPLAATEGYGSAEVERHYSRARALCQQLGESLHLFPVLSGLWRFYLIRADLAAARELAEQLLHVAQSGEDVTLLVEAHYALGVTCVNLGEFASAGKRFAQGIALYDPRQQNSYLFLYGHDPGVVCRCFEAWALWSLGFPDQALERVHEALAMARELRHPETLSYALFFAAWLHQLRRESQKALELAEAVIEYASEHGLVQWIAFGASLRGWALAEQGQSSEGIEQMRQTLAAYRAIGSEISRPHFLALLAEALLGKGQVEEALHTLTEAMAAANDTGGCYYEAELHRLKGELLLRQATGRDDTRVAELGTLRLPAPEPVALTEAETCFLQAIEVGRRQSAKSLELRAVISLSRLWQQVGKAAEARRMLQETYGWFTEGFGAADLKAAKALLEELCGDQFFICH